MLEPESDRNEAGDRNRGFAVRAAKAAWVTYAHIVINIAVFSWMIVHDVSPLKPTGQDMIRFGANHGPLVVDGEWFRLYSSIFLHAGVIHIGFNVWALHVLGPPVEKLFGNAAFFMLYTFAGLGGSIASVLWNPNGISVGASGAIFGLPGAIVAFFLAHRSRMPAGLFRAQMQRMASFLGLNILLGLSIPQIDNAAHLGGLITGFLCGLAAYRDARATPVLSKSRFARLSIVGFGLLALAPVMRWRVTTDVESGTSLSLRKGFQALSKVDLISAGEWADRAITLNPENARAHELRAGVAANGPNVEDARPFLDRALELDPELTWARHMRGLLNFEANRFEAALADADVAIAAEPTTSPSLELRAHVLFCLERWNAALRAFRAISDERSREIEYAWICRAGSGDESEATEELLRSIAASSGTESLTQWTAKYLTKSITEDDFRGRIDGLADKIDDIDNAAQLRARAWFFIGERKRLDGDRVGARNAFTRVVESKWSGSLKPTMVVIASARLSRSTSSDAR